MKQNKGYVFQIQTVESDAASMSVFKILSCNNDTLTIAFMIDVPIGLNDVVQGSMELKREKNIIPISYF